MAAVAVTVEQLGGRLTQRRRRRAVRLSLAIAAGRRRWHATKLLNSWSMPPLRGRGPDDVVHSGLQQCHVSLATCPSRLRSRSDRDRFDGAQDDHRSERGDEPHHRCTATASRSDSFRPGSYLTGACGLVAMFVRHTVHILFQHADPLVHRGGARRLWDRGICQVLLHGRNWRGHPDHPARAISAVRWRS